MNLENVGMNSEVSLECKSYSMLVKSSIDETQNLEEFVGRLEEEKVKIDAFKRELPLCMQLLTNAVEASRQQLESYREKNQMGRPVLEQFIPLKNNISVEKLANNTVDNKANWMTSAQLWSPASEETKEKSSDKTALNHSNSIGAFLPFSSNDNNYNISSCPSQTTLALASSKQNQIEKDTNKLETLNYSEREPQSNGVDTTNNTRSTQQHRKARRCWSPDLHRRFVNALQILGGSQVATPKQIRELMKVEGLTNDEVKSHLQKYRLHTRRPSPSPHAVTASAPQLVVLGSIWMPPEYATHGGAFPTSHAPPPHYITAPPAVTQQLYNNAAATPQPLQSLHHLQHPQLLHVYSNPPSNSQGTRVRSESIEDGKSESSSWKGDSSCESSREKKRAKE